MYSCDLIEITNFWQQYRFYSPPLHPIDDGGISTLVLWGWLNTRHLTLDRYYPQQLISNIYSQPGEEDTTGQVEPHRSHSLEESEQAGAVGDSL